MGLEEFEKELAAGRDDEVKENTHRSRDEEGEKRHHRHHHRSHRLGGDESRDAERRHRHKRHREGREDEDRERRHRKRQRSDSPKPAKKEEGVKVFDNHNAEDEEDEWVEKEAMTAPPGEQELDDLISSATEPIQRDSWMQEPSGQDIEHVKSRKPTAPPSQFVGAKNNHEFKVQETQINQHLADLQNDFKADDGEDAAKVEDEPAQHEVSYTFGDTGSQWRMTKLQGVYRQAKEGGQGVEDVALKRYGDLRDFDDAREEEREMDRRKTYGKDYVGLIKPSGELFEERKMKAGLHRQSQSQSHDAGQDDLPQGEVMPEGDAPSTTQPLDQTALNKLKAQMMKAKLRNAPDATILEEQYNRAASASQSNTSQPGVVVLNKMDNRHLASSRTSEVTAVSSKRGRERGLVTENEDMSISDMVRQEKRSRTTNAGKDFAERIAKDGRFTDNLDYMDENATNLSKNVMKSDINLRTTAIGDFSKMQRILDSCPLCHHEDKSDPLPTAPIVSLATRTYLTLPTEPEIAKGGAVIVPIQHRLNLLECDDDEWEEMRNFMKSLTRYYHARDKGVIFYENAAHMLSRKGHATLNCIPLPFHLAETAPAYFREAILAADEQWSQHRPLIDTLALSQKAGGFGKGAFRKSMVKEMPYFHVWFGLDGGLGHVVEDAARWPRGDLFAREVVGGMLDKGPEVVKRQGRWERRDARVERFRKKWGEFDWTGVLMEG
ncbi:Pre-mRNA-splicing factor cwf19 [Recurvomyces mirabilis]|uniref:Pre-mRNA-splicing factor cwf19 n=1 Tax=Recurvomyces mirabilis TaxID=574656 RepID=A0AAE0TRN9_9PEZI|nr:Pre-mRNA-splicing factor cwf19 [Recurvomyces mirabilis]KAK5159856.1 Pre-mRNA-splicing factor cwf19 [Recurvomyces mirabilis]